MGASHGAAAAIGLVHPLASLALLPGAVKTLLGLARAERRPALQRIGYLETAIATAFVLLAGVGLALPP